MPERTSGFLVLANAEDALFGTRSGGVELQIDVVTRSLEVLEHHVVVPGGQVDASALDANGVGAVIVNHELTVDEELRAIIARETEFPGSGFGDIEAALVLNSEPFEIIGHSRKASAPRALRDIPLACIQNANSFQVVPCSRQLVGIWCERINDSLETAVDWFFVPEDIVWRLCGGLNNDCRRNRLGLDGFRLGSGCGLWPCALLIRRFG